MFGASLAAACRASTGAGWCLGQRERRSDELPFFRLIPGTRNKPRQDQCGRARPVGGSSAQSMRGKSDGKAGASHNRRCRDDHRWPSFPEINRSEPGTVACACTLICAMRRSGVPAVQSKIESYRAKAKEYARLTVLTKSLRDGRRYRKFAEMYWALALSEEHECIPPSKMSVKTRPI